MQVVVDALKNKKTSMGSTLYDVTQSGKSILYLKHCANWFVFLGVANLDAGIGVYAPDYESYRVFAPLFDPIIQEYHNFGPKEKQPPVDLGESHLKEFPPLNPEGKFIQSTRWVFKHLLF